MLAEFRDRALQPSYDPWASVNLHGRVKNRANSTKAYKDIRVATNVGSDVDVTLTSGSPEKLLPQRKRPAQRPRFDLSKISKLLPQTPVFQNCVLLVLARLVTSRDLNSIMLNVAFLLVLFDGIDDIFMPRKKKERFE